MEINEELATYLIDNNISISLVESFTGGLASSKIVDIKNASKVFKGSIVSYQEEIKERVLNIDKKILDKYSVDSKECVLEMARSGKRIFSSDIVISFSGEAGPISYKQDVLPGTIYIGIIIFDKEDAYEFILSNMNRNEVRNKAIEIAFNKILEKLKNKWDKFLLSKHSCI